MIGLQNKYGANISRINNILATDVKVIALKLKLKRNGYLDADTAAPRKISLDTVGNQKLLRAPGR